MAHDPDLYDLEEDEKAPVEDYWRDVQTPVEHAERAYEASRIVLRAMRSVAIVVGTAIWPRKS